MPTVFLSYSRDDLPLIEQLEAQLKTHPDISIWRDQEKIYGGQKWPKVLGEAIADQDVFLLAWSKNSAASHFVEFEWTTALALKKLVIPCLLDSTPLPYSLRAAQGLPTSDPPKIVTAVTAAVPVKDADRRAQVIGKLEQIASIKPDEVAKSAKTIFHQMVMGRNVIQGEHVIVTIGAHDEKAPKKFLEKWQAWVVIMGSILAGVLALFALQKIGQIQAAKEQLKTALEYEKADKDELKKKYERLDTDHRNQHEIDLMKHSSRRLISHQLLVLEDAFNSHTINDPAPVLEILGTNATGPIHQGRDLIRKVLKPENGQGKPGTVRILLLDPTCDAMRDRMEKEEDKVGRILAEMNASLYLLADIRDRVGASAFANLELRMHKEPPDRSLLMLDV